MRNFGKIFSDIDNNIDISTNPKQAEIKVNLNDEKPIANNIIKTEKSWW